METLLASVKKFLNVTSNFKDDEIKVLISTCQYDLKRVGIDKTKVEDYQDKNIEFLVFLYCKAHFYAKTDESLRWQKTYEDLRLAISLDRNYKKQ